MNEETFQRKLAELIAEIGTLPPTERGKLEILAEQTKERHRQPDLPSRKGYALRICLPLKLYAADALITSHTLRRKLWCSKWSVRPKVGR